MTKPNSYLFYVTLQLGTACARAPVAEEAQQLEKPPAPEHRDEAEHAALPDRFRLDRQVIADAKIRSAPVATGSLAKTIDLPGEIVSDPDKTARVAALASGRIESVSFKEGQVVRRGDVLALIKVPETTRCPMNGRQIPGTVGAPPQLEYEKKVLSNV